MPFNTLMEPEVCIQNLLIDRINHSVQRDNEQFSGCERLNPEEEPGRLAVAIACESVMWFVIFA